MLLNITPHYSEENLFQNPLSECHYVFINLFTFFFFLNIKASCCDFGVRPARRTLKGLQGVAKWDAANRKTSLPGPEDA